MFEKGTLQMQRGKIFIFYLWIKETLGPASDVALFFLREKGILQEMKDWLHFFEWFWKIIPKAN